MHQKSAPALLILNQMAGPMTWELAEDLGTALGLVALFTGHPDTLQKQHANVEIFAAPTYERGSFIRRTLTWLHYCWQAFWWILRWPRQTPLLLFSNPPILVELGWLLSVLRGQPYAVMVHDIYPDVLIRTNVFTEHNLLMQLWRWLNRHAYERAVVVMTLGEYMAATLAKQFDPKRTTSGKIEIIPPWVDTDVIKPIPKEENWFAQKYNQLGKLTVMYSGNMGIGHDIETMLAAAKQLSQRDDIHFMFIGAGPKWKFIEETVKNERLSNVTLLGWQQEEVIPYSLATADVALVSLEPGFEGVMVPSKGCYAMAAGSSLILLSAGQNELELWIKNYQLGQAIQPGDVAELARQVVYLAEHTEQLYKLRSHSRQTADKLFSGNACTSSILLRIRTLMGEKRQALKSQRAVNRGKP